MAVTFRAVNQVLLCCLLLAFTVCVNSTNDKDSLLYEKGFIGDHFEGREVKISPFMHQVANKTVNYNHNTRVEYIPSLAGGSMSLRDLLPRGPEVATSSTSSKRDAVTSSPRMRTLLHIRAPCSGGPQRHTFDISLDPSSAGLTPRDLLKALSVEAGQAKGAALEVLRRYEGMGVNGRISRVLGRSATLGFGLDERARVGGGLQAPAALTTIYRQLARAAFILEAVVGETDPSVTRYIVSLKDSHVYNILCGVKVAMDSKDPSFLQSAPAMLPASRLISTPNVAFRLARNYAIVKKVAQVLATVATDLRAIAPYF